ncbi:KRAB-A domain-containing protein 2-like [Macrobrachium nipponense]|uniref:KRAB-A domain-containing protein 2-like n=1 Tax=Macrobrachium nipponense TaxID=159736 RepID=UPI0030C7F1B8
MTLGDRRPEASPSLEDADPTQRRRYAVLQCGDVEKLIKKRATAEEPTLYYVSIEDTYDIIKIAHTATGHGGRDRMKAHLASNNLNSRGQVDLVDMQSSPQAQFKWIMVHQCHLTKFVILRPLTSKRVAEVAFQLLNIFLLFGAPAIFQSDNGSELQFMSSQS